MSEIVPDRAPEMKKPKYGYKIKYIRSDGGLSEVERFPKKPTKKRLRKWFYTARKVKVKAFKRISDEDLDPTAEQYAFIVKIENYNTEKYTITGFVGRWER